MHFESFAAYYRIMSVLEKFQQYHLIGVGGVSMSAIAKFLLKIGKEVSGSDRVFGEEMVNLTELGVRCWGGTSPESVPADAIVIYTAAISDDNEELKTARLRGQTAVERKYFLAEIEKTFPTRIAVSGTHGKTTVTSMIAAILKAADAKFTAHIGGYPVGGDNLIYAGRDIFLTEACEYNRSFLALSPTHVVVTNVEMDHPDTYKNISELYAAFDSLINKKSVKMRFINEKSAYRHTLTFTSYQMHTFAGVNGSIRAESILRGEDGTYNFRIISDSCEFRVNLAVSGKVNIENALAAAAVTLSLGISAEKVKEGLENFRGVKRRFEKKGTVNGADVYVDYAHHPTEIRSAVETARDLTDKRLVVAFQPHTYSRTACLLDSFVTAFRGADRLYITASYSAREKENAGLTAYDLYREIVGKEMYCSYYQHLIPLARAIDAEVSKGDTVLILGAGDIVTLADLICT